MNTDASTANRLCRLHAMKQAQLDRLQSQSGTLIHQVLTAEAEAILRAIRQQES